METLLALATRGPVWLVAAVWAFEAVAKVVLPPDQNSWASQFPGWLMVGVTLLEAGTASLLIAGRVRLGLWLGLLLILAFVVALVAWPPVPGQSCGCAGRVEVSLSSADVAAHVFAFAALHLLAAASGAGLDLRGATPERESQSQ